MTPDRNAVLFALLALTACGPQDGVDAEDPSLAQSSLALTLSAGDTALVLALVNDPGTDAATLDTRAGLDRRAAANIIARRNGADGTAPSADDQPFASLAALDAVPYVGDAALKKLVSDAHAHPSPAGAVVKQVAFQGWEAASVVWGVNQASQTALDGMLDNRAAANLVAARPFSTLAQLGAVAWVGPSALERLRREAGTWWLAQHAAAPCTLTFAAKVVPQEVDYMTRVRALDPRSEQYWFRSTTLSVPSCFDAANPAHVEALKQKLFELAGWHPGQPEYAGLITASALQQGTASYDQVLQASLDYLDELNFDAVDAGDLQLKASLDSLYQSLLSMRALISANPVKTWSMRVYLDASEANELGGAVLDLQTGTLLFMLRPSQA